MSAGSDKHTGHTEAISASDQTCLCAFINSKKSDVWSEENTGHTEATPASDTTRITQLHTHIKLKQTVLHTHIHTHASDLLRWNHKVKLFYKGSQAICKLVHWYICMCVDKTKGITQPPTHIKLKQTVLHTHIHTHTSDLLRQNHTVKVIYQGSQATCTLMHWYVCMHVDETKGITQPYIHIKLKQTVLRGHILTHTSDLLRQNHTVNVIYQGSQATCTPEHWYLSCMHEVSNSMLLQKSKVSMFSSMLIQSDTEWETIKKKNILEQHCSSRCGRTSVPATSSHPLASNTGSEEWRLIPLHVHSWACSLYRCCTPWYVNNYRGAVIWPRYKS